MVRVAVGGDLVTGLCLRSVIPSMTENFTKVSGDNVGYIKSGR